MKVGQIVMFLEPNPAENEQNLRMQVLEDNGDRVLVQSLVPSMAILPTRTLRTADLVAVEPSTAELKAMLQVTLDALLQCSAPKRLKEHAVGVVGAARGMLEPVEG